MRDRLREGKGLDEMRGCEGAGPVPKRHPSETVHA